MSDIKHGQNSETFNGDADQQPVGRAAVDILGPEIVGRLDHAAYLIEVLAAASQAENPFTVMRPGELKFPYLDEASKNKIMALKPKKHPKARRTYPSIPTMLIPDIEKTTYSYIQASGYRLLDVFEKFEDYEIKNGFVPEDFNPDSSVPIVIQESGLGSDTILGRMDYLRAIGEGLPSPSDLNIAIAAQEMLVDKLPPSLQKRVASVRDEKGSVKMSTYTLSDIVNDGKVIAKGMNLARSNGKRYFDYERRNAKQLCRETALYVLGEVSSVGSGVFAESIVQDFEQLRPGQDTTNPNQWQATQEYLSNLVGVAEEAIKLTDPVLLKDAEIQEIITKFQPVEQPEAQGWRQEEIAQFASQVKKAKDIYLGGSRLVDPKKNPRAMENLKAMEDLRRANGEKVFTTLERGLVAAMLTDCFEKYFSNFQLVQSRLTNPNYAARKVITDQPGTTQELLSADLRSSMEYIWTAFVHDHGEALMFPIEDWRKMEKRLVSFFRKCPHRSQEVA